MYPVQDREAKNHTLSSSKSNKWVLYLPDQKYTLKPGASRNQVQ